MKKTLLALAVAASFSSATAYAQSRGPEADESLARGPTRLELYGLIDAGVEHLNVGDGVSSATRVSSGISAGSRFGFRGTEELGGGYRAVFVLENRLELDTGASGNRAPLFYCASTGCPGVQAGAAPLGVVPAVNNSIPAMTATLNAVNLQLAQSVTSVNSANALFDRQAFVGAVTPAGAILLGRQYTPTYEVLNRFSSFGDSTAGQIGQGYSAMAVRANNAIQYRAELAGLTLSLMYGAGGTEAIRSERTTVTSGDDFYGANIQYRTELFSIGAGYNRNNTVTLASPTDSQKGLEQFNFGVTGTAGPVKLFAQYMQRKNQAPVLTPESLQTLIATNPAGITSTIAGLYINAWDFDLMRGFIGPVNTKVIHVGAQWAVGPGTLYLSHNYAKDTARSTWATEDAEVSHSAIAYFYNLSRRTQLYGVGAYADNQGQSRMALGSAGYAGGFTTAAGEYAYAVQFGIRHAF